MATHPLERYFDNAASTPVDPHVLEAMLPWLSDGWGNAHSIHEPGRKAMASVDRARSQVAALLSCEPEEIYFTSGATEANNWVLKGFSGGDVSPFEHSSVYEPGRHLGYGVIPNAGYHLEPGDSHVILRSVMLVNNETGSIFDAAAMRRNAEHLHSDITQGLGKLPIELEGLDFASFSAHKLYGPKGIGGLFARDGMAPPPLLIGGEQERGYRAGTLNVAAIVGFGAACDLARSALQEDLAKVQEMRWAVLDRLHKVSDVQSNGGEIVSPYILSLSFAGVEGETLVIEMDRAGFAISSGAACSSRSTEPSHVLTALGLESHWLRGTVRISFGRFNSLESASDLGENLARTVEKLRRIT